MRDIKKYPTRPMYDICFGTNLKTRRVHQDWVTDAGLIEDAAKVLGLDPVQVVFHTNDYGHVVLKDGTIQFERTRVVEPTPGRRVKHTTTKALPLSKPSAQPSFFD